MLAAFLAVVPVAWGHYEEVGQFDVGGLTGTSEGMAVDYNTGEVYVADGFHDRVVRFGPSGEFLGAWGWNVVETGPDQSGKNQEEWVKVIATAGQFSLEYESSTTKPLAYNAEAAVVESALDALPSITTRNGRVKVKGGPGDKTGSKAYELTYEGGIGDSQRTPIGCNNESLAGGEPISSCTFEDKKGEPAFEDCIIKSGDVCRSGNIGTMGEGPGEFVSPEEVAVDQTTGDVYVLDKSREKANVQWFSADGKELIGSFGVRTAAPLGNVGEPEKNPEEFRRPVSLAVGSSGDVYIADEGEEPSTLKESRVMVFGVVAGKYEYIKSMARRCGVVSCGTTHVALDSQNNVYIGNLEKVYEFAGGEPESPICESESYIQLEGLAVNPATGESFVHSEKTNIFYGLNACKEGKLTEDKAKSFEGINKERKTTGLALNPTLKFAADRPKGVLYANSPGGPGEANGVFIFAQAKVNPPKVVSEFVSDVGTTSATFRAVIAPGGSQTHYSIQYSTESTEACSPIHQCSEVPLHGGVLEASHSEEAIAIAVGGLQPGTTYHFRVVGYSHCNSDVPAEECVLEGGADHEFVTFPSGSGLADHRAYELVSPPFKVGGGEVFPISPFATNCSECLPGVTNERFPMQSTADGSMMVYEGGPFSSGGAAVNENEYLARRGGSGWQTTDLSPALARHNGSLLGFKAFTPDLSRGVLAQSGPALCAEAPEGYADLYLVGGQQCGGSPGLRPLLTSSTPHERPASGSEEFKITFAGGSEDLSHIVVEANDALTAKTPVAPPAQDGGAGANNLYEWVNGELRLVNVLPGNKSTSPDAVIGSGADFATTAEDPNFAHAVSSDGSRIFWTDEENHHVYVRMNGDETVKVLDEGGFLTASADGSEVLLSDGHIYNPETKAVTDLTGKKGGFLGILGVSKDLSRVYFADTAILASNENSEGDKAREGVPNTANIYYWNEGTVVFVGALTFEDGFFNGGALGLLSSETGDWVASPSDRTAQVTSDGRYLVFMSRLNLTHQGHLKAETACTDRNGLPCFEVFEYDAETGRLSCASCNPTGEPPLGSSSLSLLKPGSGFLPQPSNVSSNGRVFFNSVDALSPQVRNPGVQNVYEYEPNGLGTCGHEGGCIVLISSGAGGTDSSFVNATPSGGDVFFTTRSQLVPEDKDDLIDLYDARENGGFPQHPQPQECASGETCQGGPSSSSSPLSGEEPLSSTLSGTGNLLTPPPSSPPPPPPPLPPTRAQRLAKALSACRRSRVSRSKRIACEKSARRRYGPVSKTKTKTVKTTKHTSRTGRK